MGVLGTLRHHLLGASVAVALFGLPSVHVWADEPKGDAAKPPTTGAASETRGRSAAVYAIGTIEPVEVVDVGAQAAGPIVSLGPDPRGKTDARYQGKTIDYGSPVEAGTVLTRIDDATYAAQAEYARAGRAGAEAELAGEKAKLDLAKIQWKRAELTAKSGSGPDNRDVARADLKVAEARVAAAEAALAQAKAALKQAEINLAYTIIKSPIEGIIIDRRVNVGQTVAPTSTVSSMFLIAKDLRNMQVWASVNEADVSRVHNGMKVRFTVAAFPKDVFQGTVAQTRLNATMTQNVVTYTVVIDFKNSDLKLQPCMTANVQFQP